MSVRRPDAEVQLAVAGYVRKSRAVALGGGGMSELSERDMRILGFERRGWRSPGVKEQVIAEVLDIPATWYYQLLNELIDRPEALAFDPVLVKPQRARRQRVRSSRSKGRPA